MLIRPLFMTRRALPESLLEGQSIQANSATYMLFLEIRSMTCIRQLVQLQTLSTYPSPHCGPHDGLGLIGMEREHGSNHLHREKGDGKANTVANWTRRLKTSEFRIGIPMPLMRECELSDYQLGD